MPSCRERGPLSMLAATSATADGELTQCPLQKKGNSEDARGTFPKGYESGDQNGQRPGERRYGTV